jgi:hypothetical protein
MSTIKTVGGFQAPFPLYSAETRLCASQNDCRADTNSNNNLKEKHL